MTLPPFRTPIPRRAALAAATLLLAVSSSQAQAPLAPEGAAAACADFYAKMSARDRDVLRYVPANGFSEITNGGAVHRLDAQAFDKLFASPLQIDLHVEDTAVEAFGGSALVTGTRVGSITPPGQAAVPARFAFTMLWTLTNGRWQLRHVHLSTAPAAS